MGVNALPNMENFMKKFLVTSLLLAAVFFSAPSRAQDVTVHHYLGSGWTLIGNPTSTAFSLTEVFGNFSGDQYNYLEGITEKVISVWRWDDWAQRWDFFSPLFGSQGSLQSYAEARGYGVLGYVYPGEGFWVLTRDYLNVPVIISGQMDTALLNTMSLNGLSSGWHLVAPPTSMPVSEFASMGNQSPPSPGGGISLPPNSSVSVISMWTWDTWQGKWYVHSPLLETLYGPAIAEEYLKSLGYMMFEGYVYPGMGLWLNIGSPYALDGKG